jgi:serine/threonine-protein kinase
MGIVYLVERDGTIEQGALKLLHEDAVSSDEFVRRFAREARALSRLEHPHCTTILDVGEHLSRPYILMELIRGHLLTTEIGTPGMTCVRAVGLVRQLLLGLAHAHDHNIVHRDLKPDNLMISEGIDGVDAIKILDFGFAHIADSRHSQSNASLIPGTPSYMSPEQAQGIKTDPRSDLYTAGVILYELCVGRRPFAGKDALEVLAMHLRQPIVPPRQAAPDRRISAPLERAILQALEKDRLDRFQTALEFQQALDGTPEGRKARRGVGMSNRPLPGQRRWWIVAAGAAALAGVGLVTIRREHRRAAASPAPAAATALPAPLRPADPPAGGAAAPAPSASPDPAAKAPSPQLAPEPSAPPAEASPSPVAPGRAAQPAGAAASTAATKATPAHSASALPSLPDESPARKHPLRRKRHRRRRDF